MILQVRLPAGLCALALRQAGDELDRIMAGRARDYPQMVAAGKLKQGEADARRLALEDAVLALDALEQAVGAAEAARPVAQVLDPT